MVQGGPPAKLHARNDLLLPLLSPIVAEGRAPAIMGLVGDGEVLNDRRQHHQVDKIRVELGAALAGYLLRGGERAAGTAVMPAVGDDVEGVDDRGDARIEGDLSAGELLRVSL